MMITYMLVGFILFNGHPYMRVHMPMEDLTACRAMGQKMEKEVPLVEKGNTIVWECVNVAEKS